MIFARGRAVLNLPLPEEKLILQDGSAGTFILNFSDHPEALRAIEYSLYSASMQIKENPRVYIIGAGGGNDLWAAQINNASYIKGIELNQPIIDIHYELLPQFTRALLEDERIEFVCAEGRNALMREEETYDIIQMSGIDTWTSLTSGAYVLAENYLYTREAIETMYGRLAPDGILQITRFAADMEALRLISNVSAAFDAMGVGNFDKSVMCLRTSDNLVSLLMKKGEYTASESIKMADFTRTAGIEMVYSPGRQSTNLWSRFIRNEDKTEFIRNFPRDISPTTDNQPYFFNFTKWSNPFKAKEYVQEPTHVSQGNPFFILGQLAVSILVALAFILLPLVLFRRKEIERPFLKRFLVYFSGLGIGFIAIEISLMQKLTLFLGHPLYSITVTLFAVLVFTGLGSLVSGRWFHSPGRRAWFVPISLAILIALIILFSHHIVAGFVGLSLPWRIAISVGILAPIALVLGIPFAYGIRLVNRFNPTIVPWAWAVNGFCTVIGSLLAVIVSMNLGFNTILTPSFSIYPLSFPAIRRLPA
jgi:spermidine synthase